MTERVTFQTADSVSIAGNWSAPANAKNAVLLLHMMPATRVSFSPLTAELNTAGFATLAIDLRGHGESTEQNGKKLDYKNFTDTDHHASKLDVDAAMNFLKGKGFAEGHISFVGASIGANLSLDALYRYSDTRKAVLLSPGLDYRGVKTDAVMKGMNQNQKVWLIAAKEDTYSADSVKTLYTFNASTAKLTVFDGPEHGTNLFQTQKNLIADIVKFLS